MIFSQRIFLRTGVATSLLFLAFLTAGTAQAQEFGIESVGVRYGLSSSKHGTQLMEAEGFVDFNLPWRWDLGKDWELQTKLNCDAGWLGANGDNAAVGGVGPAVQLFPPCFPLSLEGGVSPTLISRNTVGYEDLGVAFQFTSYLGLNLDITKHIRLGYRFQHISNAGLSQHNPGINMNMFALSYVF